VEFAWRLSDRKVLEESDLLQAQVLPSETAQNVRAKCRVLGNISIEVWQRTVTGDSKVSETRRDRDGDQVPIKASNGREFSIATR
jgi:hypothetical protein